MPHVALVGYVGTRWRVVSNSCKNVQSNIEVLQICLYVTVEQELSARLRFII